MAFTNLPPNLQDIFNTIDDRISKLESSPSQPMDYALSAQTTAITSGSVATNAQLQAISASNAANAAASQATIAQSQATIASTQATTAQTTANGKNKVTYSTSAPGSTANSAGDIWYQYGTSGTYLNKVIAQWTGAGGTSWTSVTISGLVVANLDAGSITTGTLSAIQVTAGSGSQVCTISSTGYLSAQGVYIKGNITADSGTFTGTVNAGSGYFGTTSNGWSIGSTGLTGVGSGTITGGSISGSSITCTAGTIGGFTISTGYIKYGSTTLYSSSGSGFCLVDLTNGISINNISVTSTTSASISTSGGVNAASGTVTGQSFTMGTGTGNFAGTINANGLFYNLGYATTTSAANAYINSSTGLLARSSSSLRYKLNVTPQEIPLDSILALAPKSFYDKASADEQNGRTDNLPRILGLIAEEVATIPVISDLLMNKNEHGVPDSVNYDRIAVALIPLLKDHEARLNKLEGK